MVFVVLGLPLRWIDTMAWWSEEERIMHMPAVKGVGKPKDYPTEMYSIVVAVSTK